ncbi:UV-endonuclease UvdE [Delitschia confertaspora ATCC 74209]|uniref:UV-endonuclease UvdE n=1 Tax=Delitschia confertaspora ATCC 74209 TaxID=1513339 RepID=A0A9P4JLG1_9PLEO|nr:UV-endonuclease UvdE [Delitschia confertaspora ATCC 74209]
MAKRKRPATTLSASGDASLPVPTNTDASHIPHIPVPLPDNVAPKTESKPSRRSGRNSAQIASNTQHAGWKSPDSGEGMNTVSDMAPEAVGVRPESSIPAGPDVAATADQGNDNRTYECASAGGAALDPATSKIDEVSEQNAADLGILRQCKNKRQKVATKHVKVNGPRRSSSPSVKATSGEAKKKEEKDVGVTADPEDEEGQNAEEGEEDVKEALSRPPPVNSAYLPLPWKGRLGYACLNTYLRNANPPVFSSRTCRIASILENRHPLKDPTQPKHATKNRPDREQPADVALGQKYVEELGLANARDIIKMLRWNDKYGIKFMRLSSEMFPFASHSEYGYKLAPFASETLREVGKVVAELGHRVTTHPGQFTQLGSPRKEVIDASIRDLEYHDEMLSLMNLPAQQDRDAVMILHLGGVFGDKRATLDRFRKNYQRLPQSVKNRLVLENDDVSWTVHDLLPVCQELNIPMVLDFHHHNIMFDSDKIREGTKDIMDLFPDILDTWKRKNITPKMHYSEPCPDAITGRSRRKHSPRVATLPPCPDTMDLMIEAKDKEQAVFELMRTFKLPGFDLFNDVIPHVRQDENKPFKPKSKKGARKGKKKVSKVDDYLDAMEEEIEAAEETAEPALVPEEEIGMGGPENRVYWPPGMEDWLRPPKRIVKKKEDGAAAAAGKKGKAKRTSDATTNGEAEGDNVDLEMKPTPKKAAPKRAMSTKKRAPKVEPTPPSSDEGSSPFSDLNDDEDHEEIAPPAKKSRATSAAPVTRRSGRARRVSYKEEEGDEMRT